MSPRSLRDSRTTSDYPPSHHRPAPSLTVQAILLTLAVGLVVVASYPLASLVAATAVVGVVAAVRLAVRRVERSALKVEVPGLPVEVTVAQTTRD